MLHHDVKEDNSGDHWAVSNDNQGKVLIQLQESGEQVRVALNATQAREMLSQLVKVIEISENINYLKLNAET